jgi:hypothetical protein
MVCIVDFNEKLTDKERVLDIKKFYQIFCSRDFGIAEPLECYIVQDKLFLN